MPNASVTTEVCEICGTTRNLDRHHVLPKRMGGSRDPAVHAETNLMTLCRNCHRKLHDGIWELQRTADRISVVDRHTGKQVMRRLLIPDHDATKAFQWLNIAEHSVQQMILDLPHLSDDQLVEAFRYATSLGKRAWLVQAAIMYEAEQRSIYGAKNVEAIARGFEISRSQAYKYALVWKVFFSKARKEESLNIETILLDEPSWYVVAATETADPEAWLAYAQDRKAEDLSYSVSRFRQDILMAKWLKGIRPSREARGLDQHEPGRGSWVCPWTTLMCTCSGRPIPIADCRQCEYNPLDRSDLTGPKRRTSHGHV